MSDLGLNCSVYITSLPLPREWIKISTGCAYVNLLGRKVLGTKVLGTILITTGLVQVAAAMDSTDKKDKLMYKLKNIPVISRMEGAVKLVSGIRR